MINIEINRKLNQPLYVQIRDQIAAAVQDGRLGPGEQLPTVAALAKTLRVTPGTVRRALEDLTKSGEIFCQVGRGTFVSEPQEASSPASPPPRTEQPPPRPLDPESKQAARRLRAGIARSLENLMALHKRPGLIAFTAGVPSPGSARDGVLKDMVLKALKRDQAEYLTCTDPAGLPELREELAERFSKTGMPVRPENLLITSGSQQALSLAAQGMLGQGRRFICETPCYTGVPRAFEFLGHWVDLAERDQEGPRVEALTRSAEDKPPLLYLCPMLHNPMGLDLSPARREFLRTWAEKEDAVLISDEIFRDLYYDGSAPPSLFSQEAPGRTIVVGSLSKSFMGGLRLGWLAADPERIRAWSELKKATDLGGPPLMQGLALALLQSGEYEAHVERVRQVYRRRCRKILKALEAHMPEGVVWTRPRGGFNMWVELPAGYSGLALFLLAVERGVSFIPGPYMDMDHRFVNAFRLSFGDVQEDRLDEGVRLLASAAADLLREPPRDLGLGGLGGFL